jgi:predicted DNA-binding ribbon-helix-helix protein
LTLDATYGIHAPVERRETAMKRTRGISVKVEGKTQTLTLEPVFEARFRRAAKERGITLSTLASEINSALVGNGFNTLTQAIRHFLMTETEAREAPMLPVFETVDNGNGTISFVGEPRLELAPPQLRNRPGVFGIIWPGPPKQK